MKYYFYAPSFVTLREYSYFKTLYPDIILISLNPVLIDFAKLMKWDLIAFPLYDYNETRVKSSFVRDIYALKYYNNLNKEIEKRIVRILQKGMFFSSCLLIDLWGIKILKQIAKIKKDVNVVCLHDYDVSSRIKKVKNLPFDKLLLQIKSSLLYGLRLDWFNTGSGEYLGVDRDKFTKKYKFENRNSVEAFCGKVSYGEVDIDIEPIRCLILGGYGIDDNKSLISTDSIRKVFNFIKKVKPDTCFKYHPGKNFHDELSDSFKQVPSGIPVEFLSKKIKIAISDFSWALISLSELGVKCISYLKLLDTYPDLDKYFWIEKLTKNSRGKIVFVDSFEELENLLKDS